MDSAPHHELSGLLVGVTFGLDESLRGHHIVLDFDGLLLTIAGTVSHATGGEDVPTAVDVASAAGRLYLATPLLGCVGTSLDEVRLRDTGDLSLTFTNGTHLTLHASAEHDQPYRIEYSVSE
jgi:hypothetical protein